MNQSELIASIGNSIAALDQELKTSALNADNVHWQQVYAMRKHLNDQQVDLIHAQIASDDVSFQTYTGLIALATKQLDDQIADMASIDSIINTVAKISASLDDVLKLA